MMLIKQCVIVLGLIVATAYGQPPGLGDSCTGLSWSGCVGYPGVVCPATTHICQCRWGWYEVTGADPPCWEGLIGDRCNTDDDCDTTDAICAAEVELFPDICLCPLNYYAVGQDCVAGIIGDRCNAGDDLCYHDDALCSGDPGAETCSCLAGSYHIEGCFEGSIGDPCIVNGNCDGANVECISGVCACPADWYAVLGDCYPGSIGDPCIITANCDGANVECISGVCDCPADRYEVLGDCYLGSIGDPCIITANCDGANVECISGVCDCPADRYEVLGDCFLGALGDPCTSDSDCSANIPGSICTGDPLTCQCPADWWFSGLVCYEAPNEGPGS